MHSEDTPSDDDGGEAILEAFRNLKIDYIFASPGSEWGSVWEALARQTVTGAVGPIYMSCWHETLAVDLAIGYTLATGRMQAVMLHAGVGLLQGSMGIHAAFIQNIPMIVLSGEALSYGERPEFDPGLQWYQNLSVVGGTHRLVEPYVKWAGQATSIETLYQSVTRCGEIAQRVPVGPVYLNAPIEVQLASWRRPTRLGKIPPALSPRAPASEIETVARLLANARTPVIITEGAGRDADSYNALLAFAEVLALPVVETPSAVVSNFPKDHPLHQGVSLAPFAQEADLVLVIRGRVPWYPTSRRPPNAIVVQIDEEPHRAHMVYQNTQADRLLEGDVAHSLEELTRLANSINSPADVIADRRKYLSQCHDRLVEDRRDAIDRAKLKAPIDPVWLLAALGEALPEDTIYVDETVTHVGDVPDYLVTKGQGTYFKVRGGLGQGLGQALGVKLANPNRTVTALLGDGAMLYNPITQSLGFSAQAGLPIVIVIFNNNEYRSMRLNQLAYYPEGTGKKHNIYPGALVGGPKFSRLGDAFDCFGLIVDSPEVLIPAIREAHQATMRGVTAIIDVLLER